MNGLGGVEREYIRRYHKHEPAENQCSSALIKHIKAPVHLVSIMQIASEKVVHIFDLIKLFEDVPDILDNCLTRIFHSPRILKLGYNFQCDEQLALSYGDLECFKHYEMLQYMI